MSRNTFRMSFLGLALVLWLSASSISAQSAQPLCHSTGSKTNPFVVIEPGDPGYKTHLGHGDVPAVNGQCGGAPSGVPEPVTMLLLGAGLAGIGYAKRRMSRKAA